MAKKRKEFPGGPTRGRYDWSTWLNGDVWELESGDDFEVDIASMRAIASRAAKQAGKKLRTRVIHNEDGTDSLVIQAYT